jgi:polyisoprenoid-binding protein YceI
MNPKFSVIIFAILAAFVFSRCTNIQTDETSSDLAEVVPTVDETRANNSANTGSSLTLFSIVPAESRVRFELEEHLRSAKTGWSLGALITVVADTDQVAGELALDPNNLAASQVGVIRVNARTFDTDEYMRERAIKNRILDTAEYEFITFAPTNISGLPEKADIGDTVTFSLDGDLTIRDTTLAQTFAVTATLISDSEIHGSGSTVVLREEYGLTIPNVPNVTFVEEEVELYIDFVARTP